MAEGNNHQRLSGIRINGLDQPVDLNGFFRETKEHLDKFGGCGSPTWLVHDVTRKFNAAGNFHFARTLTRAARLAGGQITTQHRTNTKQIECNAYHGKAHEDLLATTGRLVAEIVEGVNVYINDNGKHFIPYPVKPIPQNSQSEHISTITIHGPQRESRDYVVRETAFVEFWSDYESRKASIRFSSCQTHTDMRHGDGDEDGQLHEHKTPLRSETIWTNQETVLPQVTRGAVKALLLDFIARHNPEAVERYKEAAETVREANRERAHEAYAARAAKAGEPVVA